VARSVAKPRAGTTPLISVSCGFAAGIGLAYFYGPAILISIPSALCILGLLISSLLLRNNLPAKWLNWLLLVPAVTVGFVHALYQSQPPGSGDHIYNQIGERTEAVCYGVLQEMVTYDGTTSRLLFQAEAIRGKEDKSFRKSSGLILYYLRATLPENIHPGDHLLIRGDLYRPHSPRSPGAFNFAQMLARKHIWISGTINSPAFVSHTFIKTQFLSRIRYFPEQIRQHIGRLLDKAHLQPDTSAMYRAILLGDKSKLPLEILENFKESGAFHILAISGLHLAVICLLLFSFFRALISRLPCLLLYISANKAAVLLSMPPLLFYGLLAGMNTPIMRASIMASLVLLALLINRRKSPGSLIAAAALGMLIFDPLQLYTISFQLSFCAIWSILILFPWLQSLVSHPDQDTHSRTFRFASWAGAALLVSITAAFMTAPLALAYFHRISLVGPIANLFLEPLICLWSLPNGLLAIVSSLLSDPLSHFFLQLGSIGIQSAHALAAFFAQLPFSFVWLPSPPIWLLICTYLLLLLIFAQSRTPPLPLVAVLSLAAACGYWQFQQRKSICDDELRVHYLDVGQGSCSLVEFSSGERVLIDGGGSLLGKTSVGERIIAPYLWSLGIRELDLVILTHPDSDHYNGLPFILTAFVPKLVWLSAPAEDNPHYQHFLDIIHQRNIPFTVPTAGNHLSFKGGEIECIANLNIADERSISQRNGGIVIKASGTTLSALFPGDIEERHEQLLLGHDNSLQATFLLAAHHGSNTSNTRGFLNRVAPQAIFVSSGPSQSARFPGNELLVNGKELDIPIYTTAERGTMLLRGNNGHWQLTGHALADQSPLARLVSMPLAQH
jgi:competence protein ComEC